MSGKFRTIEEWADLHGETLMGRSQFEREEEQEKTRRQERNEQKYTLTLTAVELDWLLFDLMDSAMERYKEDSVYSEKVRAQRNMWWAQADAQGFEVF